MLINPGTALTPRRSPRVARLVVSLNSNHHISIEASFTYAHIIRFLEKLVAGDTVDTLE